jgi:lipid-A-disaccharide synthase
MKSLQKRDAEADFRYFGGDEMQAVGGRLLKHYREMAYMGIIPVLLHLPAIFRNFRDCRRAIAEYRPDAVILVDYPGFNLRIAKWVHGTRHTVHDGAAGSCTVHRTPCTVYYISPKVWAWKSGRVKAIKKYIDRMFCILPFEVDFYKKYDYAVEYVGNPTVDEIVGADLRVRPKHNQTRADTQVRPNSRSVIALLPGSRRQEIKDNLPAMLEAAASFPDYQAVIAGAPGIDPAYYQTFTKEYSAPVVFGQTYDLLRQAEAALVTSGTATLETALLGTPQAVCYRMPLKHLTSFVFEHFFSCPYISLVNLIAGKTVVQELFGKHFSVDRIRGELFKLLHDEAYRQEMEAAYRQVAERLGPPGAPDHAARSMVEFLKQ